jgi:hypothetical protein
MKIDNVIAVIVILASLLLGIMIKGCINGKDEGVIQNIEKEAIPGSTSVTGEMESVNAIAIIEPEAYKPEGGLKELIELDRELREKKASLYLKLQDAMKKGDTKSMEAITDEISKVNSHICEIDENSSRCAYFIKN